MEWIFHHEKTIMRAAVTKGPPRNPFAQMKTSGKSGLDKMRELAEKRKAGLLKTVPPKKLAPTAAAEAPQIGPEFTGMRMLGPDDTQSPKHRPRIVGR